MVNDWYSILHSCLLRVFHLKDKRVGLSININPYCCVWEESLHMGTKRVAQLYVGSLGSQVEDWKTIIYLGTRGWHKSERGMIQGEVSACSVHWLALPECNVTRQCLYPWLWAGLKIQEWRFQQKKVVQIMCVSTRAQTQSQAWRCLVTGKLLRKSSLKSSLAWNSVFSKRPVVGVVTLCLN